MARIQRLPTIQTLPADQWAVDGVLSGLSLLWGEPGLGKSFVAISLAAAVAAERPWLGRHTRGGRVVYVAGEGGSEAVGRRLRTALSEWGVDPEAEATPLDVVTPGVDLTTGPTSLLELVADGEPPRLLIVDTLSRCFTGDENKQEFMAKFVRSLDVLRDTYPGCTVLVIHHANRQQQVRGSSVLTGAVDVSWRLARSKPPAGEAPSNTVRYYNMVPEKLRERDVMGAGLQFALRQIGCKGPDGELELDSLGDVQTSLILKPHPEDLSRARFVQGVGVVLLAEKPQITYAEWRDALSMEKAQFDSALSFIVTYPGEWGGIEMKTPGVFSVEEKK